MAPIDIHKRVRTVNHFFKCDTADYGISRSDGNADNVNNDGDKMH